MTHLRQLMLDELQRRNYSQSAARIYIHTVEDFAKYSPIRRFICICHADTRRLFPVCWKPSRFPGPTK
jgi:hypothetical protein